MKKAEHKAPLQRHLYCIQTASILSVNIQSFKISLHALYSVFSVTYEYFVCDTEKSQVLF